jgi:hypothetical protein
LLRENTVPVQCPYSARTVPIQCPHSARSGIYRVSLANVRVKKITVV